MKSPSTEHLLPQRPGARGKTLPLTPPFRSALWPPKIPKIQTAAATFLRCGQGLQGFFSNKQLSVTKRSTKSKAFNEKIYLISKEPLLISLLYLFSYSCSGRVEYTGAQFQPKAATLNLNRRRGRGWLWRKTKRSVVKKKMCVYTWACVLLSKALHTRSRRKPRLGSSHCQSQHVLDTQPPHLVSLEWDSEERWQSPGLRLGTPCWRCSQRCEHVQGHTTKTLPSLTSGTCWYNHGPRDWTTVLLCLSFKLATRANT